MRYILLISVLVLLSACVKDPNDSVSNDFFDIWVKSSPNDTRVKMENAVFEANNTTRYTIELEEKDGLGIDDNKQVTVSVSDGGLSTISNAAPSTATNSINIITLGGRATFFYFGGKNGKNGAVLTLTIQGQNQVVSFNLLPSEPDQILLSPPIQTQNINENITIMAYLKKNQIPTFVSQGLQVEFETAPFQSSDTVRAFAVPNFGVSTYQDANTFTSVQKVITTNRLPGKVKIWAHYTRQKDQQVVYSDTAVFTMVK